jgi:hypothetical protein
LADFGFSSFAPVLEGHGGSEPTDIIRGFTDTYGKSVDKQWVMEAWLTFRRCT